MQETVRIAFRWEHAREPARAFLDALNLDPGVAEVRDFGIRGKVDIHLLVTLATADERLARLLAELRRLGIEWDEYWRDRYTEEELDNARLLVISPNEMVQVDGGAQFGTTYDLSTGCRTCGTGSPQTSAMFLDGRYDEAPRLMGHRMAITYYKDILLDERLAEELDALAPTGLVLRSVYAVDSDTKRQTKLRFRQLCSSRTLPPMSPRTTGLFLWDNHQCPVCKRDSYTEGRSAPPRYTYRAADVAQVDDVNESWEWFSFSSLEKKFGYIKLGRPRILVTPRVMRVIRAAGVTEKEFEFIPIRVTED